MQKGYSDGKIRFRVRKLAVGSKAVKYETNKAMRQEVAEAFFQETAVFQIASFLQHQLQLTATRQVASTKGLLNPFLAQDKAKI